MASPYRWTDLEVFLRKDASKLSEIYWDGVETFLDEYEKLLSGPLHHSYIAQEVERWANSVQEKKEASENCIGFIDGTVLKIARPSHDGLQIVDYNGHKRSHVLKFQAVTTPDGIIMHAYGPVEGLRHDWGLYVRLDIDQRLGSILMIDEKQYCIHGDSAYNERKFLQIPVQGSELSDEHKAYNAALATGPITVEWIAKEAKLY